MDLPPSDRKYLAVLIESTLLLGITQLESEEISRILKLSGQTEGITARDKSGLMEEVSVDYLRSMNKIVMEAQIKEVTCPAGSDD